MLNKRWQEVCRIRCTDEVCKPAEGAVVKSYGAERSVRVRAKKLNTDESLLKCRKDSLQAKAEISPIEATNCNGKSVYWLQACRH